MGACLTERSGTPQTGPRRQSLPSGRSPARGGRHRRAFRLEGHEAGGETWRRVADQLRGRWPKLADLMNDSEHDVLAYMAFPRQHRTKLHSTNPIERLNKEVKRRADVVGIFPNEESIMRLIGAVLFEQNDEWQTASRYMMVEAFAEIDAQETDPILSISNKAA
nr:transposase [Roseibium sp. CAU 1639]